METKFDPAKLIERLIDTELVNRTDNLNRAKMSPLPIEELADYEEDVRRAVETKVYWIKLKTA